VTHDDVDDALSTAACCSSSSSSSSSCLSPRRARWAGLALLKMRQTTQSATAAPPPWELTWITDSSPSKQQISRPPGHDARATVSASFAYISGRRRVGGAAVEVEAGGEETVLVHDPVGAGAAAAAAARAEDERPLGADGALAARRHDDGLLPGRPPDAGAGRPGRAASPAPAPRRRAVEEEALPAGVVGGSPRSCTGSNSIHSFR
jgi:hypothetical protein